MTTATHRSARAALSTLLAGFAGFQAGCCQYPCYQQPACPPVATQPAVVRYGAVCEVPSTSGPTIISQAKPGSSSSVVAEAPRPRVVVSEPSGRVTGRAGWRRSDPESIATTRSEGAIDDEPIRR
jgi:hypothetical protein